MNTSRARGFTIVEVMLFLAVTGVLIAALLGGWTVMINTQRYRDSVDTLYTYLQDQYNLVYNVENERSETMNCDSSGNVTDGSVPSSKTRGQSDCVLLGRYVRLTDGMDLKSYAIVGTVPGTDSSGDEADIRSYEPQAVTQNIGLTETSLRVPWEAEATVSVGTQTGKNFAFIIIRAPESGTVHTYVVETTSVDPIVNASDITSTNENKDTTLCVDPGALIQGGHRGVVIRAFASSANSIETLEDGSVC